MYTQIKRLLIVYHINNDDRYMRETRSYEYIISNSNNRTSGVVVFYNNFKFDRFMYSMIFFNK